MKVLMISTDQKVFEPGSEVLGRLRGYAESFGELTVLVLGSKRVVQAEGKLAYFGLTRRQAWWWRPSTNFDLVVAQDPFETGLIGQRLAHKTKSQLELQVHTDFLNPYFARQSFVNKIRVRIAKKLLPQADRVRVVSQRIKDSFDQTGIRLRVEPEIKPVAVDTEKLKAEPVTIDLHQKYPQFGKVILMLSRLTWEKNIPLALEALSLVRLVKPTIGLVIVGSGPEQKKLETLVKSLSLREAVVFEPWTNSPASYYKTADLFLNTSFYEGYGRTIVEAKACGLPVISTDVGIAAEAGAIITPDDSVQLSSLILQTL